MLEPRGGEILVARCKRSAAPGISTSRKTSQSIASLKEQVDLQQKSGQIIKLRLNICIYHIAQELSTPVLNVFFVYYTIFR